jgi:hypothetical protein
LQVIPRRHIITHVRLIPVHMALVVVVLVVVVVEEESFVVPS